MTIILTKKATQNQIKKMCYELEYGCKQENLWGGGWDFTTGTIDYNSMINVRPNQDNSSRDILSQELRDKFKSIIEELLL